MGATEELLYSFPVRKSSDRVSVTDQLLYGDRATSGRQVGTGEFAPIEKPPVAISEPSMGAGALTSFMAGVPTDKQAAIRFFAQRRGIPENRYQVIGGDIAYQADDGKFYKEVSGVLPNIAYYTPDVLEMAPDVAAGVAMAPVAISSPVGTAAAATTVGSVAAGTNIIRQKIAERLAGQEFDVSQPIIAGLLSGGAELAPAIRKGFVERRTARDIAQVNPSVVQSLRSKAGKYNIPLTPGELTGLSSLLAWLAWQYRSCRQGMQSSHLAVRTPSSLHLQSNTARDWECHVTHELRQGCVCTPRTECRCCSR